MLVAMYKTSLNHHKHFNRARQLLENSQIKKKILQFVTLSMWPVHLYMVQCHGHRSSNSDDTAYTIRWTIARHYDNKHRLHLVDVAVATAIYDA